MSGGIDWRGRGRWSSDNCWLGCAGLAKRGASCAVAEDGRCSTARLGSGRSTNEPTAAVASSTGSSCADLSPSNACLMLVDRILYAVRVVSPRHDLSRWSGAPESRVGGRQDWMETRDAFWGGFSMYNTIQCIRMLRRCDAAVVVWARVRPSTGAHALGCDMNRWTSSMSRVRGPEARRESRTTVVR